MNSEAGKMNGEKVISEELQICGNITMRNATATLGKCSVFGQDFIVNRN